MKQGALGVYLATALASNLGLGAGRGFHIDEPVTPDRLIPNPEKQAKAEAKRQRKLERNRRNIG